MKNSLFFILQKLLKKYDIKVNESELKFQLLSHPSYPSLHSLTGVLDHFKVENVALEVPKTEELIKHLPESFIAHIKNKSIDEIVLVSLKVQNVILYYNNKSESISIKDFMILWTGVLVVIEKDKEYKKTKGSCAIWLKQAFVFFALIAVVGLFVINKPESFHVLHFILSLVGLGMSVVIIKHELGFDSIVADKFCSGNIEKINCDDVLKSKGSKFFNFLNFSDIGIIYFVSLILSWILLSDNNSCNLIIAISLLAIPFTFYSILYQYFVVKKWCTLCLSIILILWLQAGSLYYADLTNLFAEYSLQEAFVVVCCFLVVTGFWQSFLPKLKKESELKNIKLEFAKFKRNYFIYEALNAKSNQIDTKVDEISEISFGNLKGKLKIIIVTNPLCGHCKEVHHLFEEILKLNNNEISLTIRFNIHLDRKSYDTLIALKLIDLFNVNKELCLQAMHDIYGKLTPDKWLTKWGEVYEPEYIKVLNIEKQWCLKKKINFTPEIIVNERPFPKEYNRMDLLYFIDDILED
ncbi:MAG: hypothetical protein JEY96_08950 [Bacteroidales bacterium]|nr:hypothetical protein [Bacteroidales bacterium]